MEPEKTEEPGLVFEKTLLCPLSFYRKAQDECMRMRVTTVTIRIFNLLVIQKCVSETANYTSLTKIKVALSRTLSHNCLHAKECLEGRKYTGIKSLHEA